MTCFELFDSDFDDMHHALGRPKNVLVASYRNSFCANIGTPTAERLSIVAEKTKFWQVSHRINAYRSIIFEVTDEGRAALADWLEVKGK